VGKRVPLLGGATLDGGRVSADTFRGKWVVVNFVAEWCTACKVEHPDLVAFQQAHPEDVQVVGVAYDSEGNEELRTFFEENGGNPWPVITSDDGRAAIEFGVTAVPETFVVAPSQIVIAHAEGVTLEWLEDVLAQGKALQAAAKTTPTSAAPPTSAASR
jgi:cytochrome c biogenesis protein CcmG/thiol:disulfide interchange protein DsbE